MSAKDISNATVNSTANQMPNVDQMRATLRELGSNKRSVMRATFDALLPEIEQAIKEEHPIKVVWETLRRQGLNVSLATFRKWLPAREPKQDQ